MPFIWDDNQYMLVDEADDYDKNRFVIARKLFVTLNKKDEDEDESQVIHFHSRKCLEKFLTVNTNASFFIGKFAIHGALYRTKFSEVRSN